MFFTETPDWSALGASLIEALVGQHGAQGLDPASFGLVLITTGAAGPEGFAHRGAVPVYPCSLVKTFHLIHALARLEDARIPPHGEMDRALRDMIRWSSNGATNYAIDLITGPST